MENLIPSPNRIGKLIKSYRKSQQLSLVDLAQILEISKQELWTIENSKKNISLKRIVKFSKNIGALEKELIQASFQDQLEEVGINRIVTLR